MTNPDASVEQAHSWKTAHLVDPDLAPLLARLPNHVFSVDRLPELRRALLERLAVSFDESDGVTKEERFVPGIGGQHDVRVIVFRPVNVQEPAPVLVHAHGGGYVMGAPEMAEIRNRRLSRSSGAVIVSIDYRKAPETPFPGALEDAYAVLRHVQENATTFGIDPHRIGIAGESAGGGLAASLAILARDRGEVPVVFQMLVYPMLDDRTCGDQGFAGEFVWGGTANEFSWRALLPTGWTEGELAAYAVPARNSDFTGLPPALIVVGSLDLFVIENINYARSLIEAGIPTELHIFPGAFHGFDMHPDAEVAQRCMRITANAVRRAFNLVPTAAEDSELWKST